jgi:hypothetical protein
MKSSQAHKEEERRGSAALVEVQDGFLDARSRFVKSELGQTRKCPGSRGTSVLPSGADIVSLPRHVRLV